MEFATFYVGSGLSPYLRACLSSWSFYGHTLDLYTYDPAVVVPPGVTRRDANEIVPSSELYTYRKGQGAGSVAAFANEFRYRLVRERTVVWVDTDVLCLRADWPEREYYLAWESPRRELCNGAVLGVPRNSDLLERLLGAVAQADRTALSFGETGPRLLTRLLGEMNRHDLPASFEDFYPLHFTECRHLFDPALREAAEDLSAQSYALHLWDEIWTRARVPTFLRPPKDSYLEAVLARHGVVIPVEAYFEDLDALAFVEPSPVVAFNDYEALREWANSMEQQLLARTPLVASETPPEPSKRRTRRFGSTGGPDR